MYLNEFKNLLRENHIFEKYNIEQLAIFGSVARGDNGKDIDILVRDNDIKKWIKFRDELQAIAKVPIDIVIEKFADPIVLLRAKKEVVYVKKSE